MKKEITILVLLFSFFLSTSFTNYLLRSPGLASVHHEWPGMIYAWQIAPVCNNTRVEDGINEGIIEILPGIEPVSACFFTVDAVAAGNSTCMSIFPTECYVENFS